MTIPPEKEHHSAFNEFGFKNTIRKLIDQTKDLYLKDNIPWVIGYSGGKDSTAILQIVWSAIAELSIEKKAKKEVHVISTDTLVENPIVALWVERSLAQMLNVIRKQDLPIIPHRLTPKTEDRFWVNLIGKGYPAPRYKFRWCTERLKINPSNTFIQNVVKSNGEAILVLGTRKLESTVRAASMENIEQRADNTRKGDGLNVNSSLDRVWVYTPIEDWTNEDVWVFLTQEENPWAYKNDALLTMYKGATEGGECPLVVDQSTPSCGGSRFGCYVCTMVSEDKSMGAMIANDDEKEWMLPLLQLRNEIDINDRDPKIRSTKIARDKSNRDFRRMNGELTLHISMKGFSDSSDYKENKISDRIISKYQGSQKHKYENLPADIVRGPYRQEFREYMLARVLEAQVLVQKTGPQEVKNLELLDFEDLETIRKIWVEEKKETEDTLPQIYERVTGEKYKGAIRAYSPIINNRILEKLEMHCKEHSDPDSLKYYQLRSLLAIEDKYKHQLRRAKITEELSRSIDKGAFSSIDDARRFALERARNEYAIKLNRLKNDGEAKDFLRNITANITALNAQKDLSKHKKYKTLLSKIVSMEPASSKFLETAKLITISLKKIYSFYIQQIDISLILLDQKQQEINAGTMSDLNLTITQ